MVQEPDHLRWIGFSRCLIGPSSGRLFLFFSNEIPFRPFGGRARRHVIAELRVNDEIRAAELRVVDPLGKQLGVMPRQNALYLADGLGWDLVEVAPGADPPVARMMDYGKFKYEQSVKEREARKKQSRSTVKELTFKVKIGNHDYEIKRDRALRFLTNGDRVRVRVWLRGREASRPQLGMAILERLSSDLAEVATVDQPAKLEGRKYDHGPGADQAACAVVPGR